jgi:RNA polymerase sigma-70 factor (ECF subfamily)
MDANGAIESAYDHDSAGRSAGVEPHEPRQSSQSVSRERDAAIARLRELGASREQLFGESERAALEYLYRRYSPALFQIAVRLTRGRDDAEDVVQELFVSLPTALQRYRPGNFDAWLKRVTARIALMKLRTVRRQASVVALRLPALGDEAISADDFAALENHDAIRRALEQLPESWREIVVLRIFLDFTHREIAEMLEISPNLSEVRLCRALKRLRLLLRAYGPEGCATARPNRKR